MPYLYNLSLEASNTGHPIIRPTLYHFQNDTRTHSQSFDFMLGPCLLISSIYAPGEVKKGTYLPSAKDGIKWCCIWDGRWYDGGSVAIIDTPLERHGAVYAIEGAMIPFNPEPFHCIDSSKDTKRQILIFPSSDKGQSEYVVSDDNGLEKIPLLFTYKVSMQWNEAQVEVDVDVLEQKWTPSYTSVIFVMPMGDNRNIIHRNSGSSIHQIEVFFNHL